MFLLEEEFLKLLEIELLITGQLQLSMMKIFDIRTAFETWHNHIVKLDNNSGATNPTEYMVDAKVYQLGRGYGSKAESKKK